MMETKGAIQARQQPPAVSSHASSPLQRTYACEQHTIAGGECDECRRERKRLAMHSGIVPVPPSITPSSIPKPRPTEQEDIDESTSPFGESRFVHDFSQVPTHGGLSPHVSISTHFASNLSLTAQNSPNSSRMQGIQAKL